MHLDAHVAIATHIPGKLNVLYDRLSRNVSAIDLDIDASKEYDASSDHAFISMLQLCDPDADLPDITAHTQLLQQCQHILVQ
jgi:prephenate dehydratase